MTDWLVRRFVGNDAEGRGIYGRLSGSVGIICNIVLFGIKLLAGLVSGSVAIIADALNNLSDIGSSVVTMLGFRMASKPADQEHPFGHGRMEYMSGFIVSILICLVGLELLRSSVTKIFNPEPLKFSPWTVGILACAILVKLWMGFFNRSLSRRIHSEALRATAMDSFSDCLATSAVLFSTLAMLIFSVQLDAYVGILVALFILYTGIKTAKDTMDPLVGQAPDPEKVQELERRVLEYDSFVGVHDLVIHSYGHGRNFASLHVEVPTNADIIKCHEQIDLCEREVGRELGIILVIHMDPIATDDRLVNVVKQQVETEVAAMNDRMSIHDFRMVEGEKQINLIFDLVVPADCSPQESVHLKEQVGEHMHTLNPAYVCVINVDRNYTG